MLKKTITYTDYNGTERVEDFYFNLSKPELVLMKGNDLNLFKSVIANKDETDILKTFKYLILKSYGEKSDDGKRFIKSEEISNAFVQSEAYSVLFMELATNETAALDFANSIIPSDLSEKNKPAASNTIKSITPMV